MPRRSIKPQLLLGPAPLTWLSTWVPEMKERVSEVSRRTVNVLKDTRNAVTMSFS